MVMVWYRSRFGWRQYAGGMDSDALASMYAEIVRGTAKSKSRFAGKSAEASRLWDQIEADVAARVKSHPGVVFDIPNEVPAV